jgi:hypothetical protein
MMDHDLEEAIIKAFEGKSFEDLAFEEVVKAFLYNVRSRLKHNETGASGTLKAIRAMQHYMAFFDNVRILKD